MRLFVLLSRIPYPLDKGDRLRAYHQIRHLHAEHEITLCCLSDEKVSDEQRSEVSKICHSLHILPLTKAGIAWQLALGMFSRKPFQVHYFYQKSVQRSINKLIAEVEPEHIYCQLIRTTEYVKTQFEIPKTIDYMDALSMGMKRRINGSPWFKRELIRLEGERLQDYENLIFDYFDKHTIISEQDKKLIIHPNRNEVQIVPNGVDQAFFAPQPKAELTYDLVFVGNMSYAPNVAAAEYLVKNIVPLLEKELGSCKVLLAGVNPHKQVKALTDENVVVSGRVEDIRDAYASGKVFVAPLQIGTGLQNKLLEAMSMGKACVTSLLVNNALKAIDGEHLYVCQNPREYAVRITELLQSEEARNALGARARAHVSNMFSWQATSDQISALFQQKSPSE